jgi:polyisoprenyl-phosphate glycosyltransferase
MKISVVIPTYRSEGNLSELLSRLNKVALTADLNLEILVVDDNSPDNTLAVLRDAGRLYGNIKVLSLSRNFGQQIAISAGLKYATGDAVIIMDDDLQDPPEFIPSLINKWQEGYDIVYAIRINRKENFLKRAGYKFFYKTLSLLSEIDIPHDSGDFCIISRHIAATLNNMTEKGRFIRGMRAWVGYKQIGIDCSRDARFNGPPAYTFFKTVKLALDGIFSFSNGPLRLIAWVGLVVWLAGCAGIFITLFQRILYLVNSESKSIWQGFNFVFLAILFVGGLQIIALGIIGEYIGRIFNEVKQRPLFLIKEAIGIDLLKD